MFQDCVHTFVALQYHGKRAQALQEFCPAWEMLAILSSGKYLGCLVGPDAGGILLCEIGWKKITAGACLP